MDQGDFQLPEPWEFQDTSLDDMGSEAWGDRATFRSHYVTSAPRHRKAGSNSFQNVWGIQHTTRVLQSQADFTPFATPQLEAISGDGMFSLQISELLDPLQHDYSDLDTHFSGKQATGFGDNLSSDDFLENGFGASLNNEDLVKYQPSNLNLTATKSSKISKNKSSKKPRIPCSHAGCKFTFPRNYELRRHEANVHGAGLEILCSVSECKRVAIPFPREDKFNEHARKHHSQAHIFVCPIKGCRRVPLDLSELSAHHNDNHSQIDLSKPGMKSARLSMQSIGLRQTQLPDNSWLFESTKNCALAFLGCSFRSNSEKHRNILSDLMLHYGSHDMLQISKGYEAIVSVSGDPYRAIPSTIVICPICKEVKMEGLYWFIDGFCNHIASHTSFERTAHAEELSQLFRPWLEGKDTTWTCHDIKSNIGPDLKAAGVWDGENKVRRLGNSTMGEKQT